MNSPILPPEIFTRILEQVVFSSRLQELARARLVSHFWAAEIDHVLESTNIFEEKFPSTYGRGMLEKYKPLFVRRTAFLLKTKAVDACLEAKQRSLDQLDLTFIRSRPATVHKLEYVLLNLPDWYKPVESPEHKECVRVISSALHDTETPLADLTSSKEAALTFVITATGNSELLAVACRSGRSDSNWKQLLCAAAKYGRADAVPILIRSSPGRFLFEPCWEECIYLAAENDHEALLQTFLDDVADLSNPANMYVHVLSNAATLAAKGGSLSCVTVVFDHVKTLAERRSDIKDAFERSHEQMAQQVFAAACKNFHLEVVTWIVDHDRQHGRNTWEYKHGAYSELECAARFGQVALVEYLLDLGLNWEWHFSWINDRDSDTYESVLAAAAAGGYMTLARRMLERGCGPEGCSSPMRWSPLRAAVDRGHAHMVDFLLSEGARVELALDQRPPSPYDLSLSAQIDSLIGIASWWIGSGQQAGGHEAVIRVLEAHREASG